MLITVSKYLIGTVQRGTYSTLNCTGIIKLSTKIQTLLL